MGDGFLMQIDYSLDDISQILYGLADAEMVDFVEIIKECSPIYIFECEIYLIMVLEVSKKADNVWMIETRVQTNLIGELVQHFEFCYFSFYYLFDCYKKT
jgi:hypothetical protein